MMTILVSQMSILLLLLLSVTTFHKSMCSNHTLFSCNENDRQTMLTFKQGLNDSRGIISTWSTEKDCCAWKGVHCDSITGRVTKLDLNNCFLEGKINLSILELEFLSYLDLSLNKFDVIRIPSIQHNITHASNLLHLDLSYTVVTALNNLQWLSPLSSLKNLNLNGIDLHKETNWLQAVATLSSLLELHLSKCKLNNFINPSLEYLNLSSLVTLDLSWNNFTSPLPNGFFNLTKDITYLDLSVSHIYGEMPSSLLYLPNLRHLDLSYNQLQGSIPNGIRQLEHIKYLDLNKNHLHRSIPYGIGQLAHIQYLDLSKNMLSGFIPSTLGNLSSLYSLSIGSNNFSSEISNRTFSKLYSLGFLDLSSLNIVFQFDLDWVPPFQLGGLYLAHINQGPNFPSWIYTQKSLEELDISSSGISLVDRNKFFSLIEGINNLYLSNNSIAEDISNLTLLGYEIWLDHNNFTGGLPNISVATDLVDLSYNSFSGSIPHIWTSLEHLFYINLWSNRLSGEVPVDLFDLKQLEMINLGENQFSGTIPMNMSRYLEVVILRANQFEGNIPPQLFELPLLFHLDLAHNKLSGSMPACKYNLTHMINYDRYYYAMVYSATNDAIELFTKGQEYYLYDVSPNRRTIDLSANNLSGEVPLELFHLVQVQTLNLSHNNLIGTIPKMIGGMKYMESLDLSNNMFCGEIPQSMALLNFLEVLNLSCNNFDGKIPIGTQLQSFNASSYIGNPKLCGAPLSSCTTKEENPKIAMPSTENEDDDSIRESLYLGMGVGFAVGFWGICGSLFLIRKWRHAYYRFIDGMGDKLYGILMVKLIRFHRN